MVIGRARAQLGTISVGSGSQSTCTTRSVEFGMGPNWEQFRLTQVPRQLASRSVELGAGPNWEQIGPLGLWPALVIGARQNTSFERYINTKAVLTF